MTAPNFRPFHDRYLVVPDKAEEKSEQIGDYVVSETADPHEKPVEGIVVACGDKCTYAREGTRVVFGKYSGYEQEIDGTKYLILAESELLGERPRVSVPDATGNAIEEAEDVPWLPAR